MLIGPPVAAQTIPAPERDHHPARHRAQAPAKTMRSGASHAFDATYYHLQITVDAQAQRIIGTTRAEGVFMASRSALRLDLLSNMTVHTVRDGTGTALAFTHANDILTIDLGKTVAPGERIRVDVAYDGDPQATGFGAFAFASRDGQPVAWTLSEPYGARAWWPGKDHPSDKVDSARVTVTVPLGLRVGSNGRLLSITEDATTTTYDWQVGYPIAPYLLSLAVGPYAAFEQTYIRPDSLAAYLGPLSLPVLHYAYTSGGMAALPAGWAEVLDALAVFEWWFGPYPFPEEKYGHAQFGWGGGMEHQTMSSMGGSHVGLVTHELAHQWFGDAVTTRTWPHLWLNEGFASYAEILYWEAMAERYPGWAESVRRVDQRSARSAVGTLVVQDTLTVSNLFAGNRVYAKGSAVLHMLRHVLGDVTFRATLQAYLTDPALAYGTAITADLQRVAEAVSGRALDTFFRQWVTEGTGYPIYELQASSRPAPEGGYTVTLTLRQTQTPPQSNVEVFQMPVTLAIETAMGQERFVVENTQREQTFTRHVDAQPLGVLLDPGGVLLRNDGPVVVFESFDVPETFDFQVMPNPTTGFLQIRGTLPETGPLRIDLVNVLGRHIRSLWDSSVAAGPFRLDVNLDDVASGTYFVSIQHPTTLWTRPFVVVR